MSDRTNTPSSTRTIIRRLPELASHDPAALHAIVDESYVCHIAFSSGDDTHCIPTAHWRSGNYIYIHGSNGSRMIKALSGGTNASVAITLIDGLVLAKAAFNHTMNYRSAVIYGQFETVEGNEEKLLAFDVLMDKIAKGRKDEVRRGNPKELAATTLLRLPLDEAAVKISNTSPTDKDDDVDLPVWTGILPLATTRKPPICSGSGQDQTIPDYARRWADC